MGREIRRVPANWEHPQRNDSYRPLYQNDFDRSYKDWEKELAEWYEEYRAFEKGKVFSYKDKSYSKEAGDTYEDWAGEPPTAPSPYNYMPKGEWWQAFENVSKGTPITPAFETKEELKKWMCENPDFWGRQWSVDAVENFVKEDGYLPSGIITGGKMYRPEQQYRLVSNPTSK